MIVIVGKCCFLLHVGSMGLRVCLTLLSLVGFGVYLPTSFWGGVTCMEWVADVKGLMFVCRVLTDL